MIGHKSCISKREFYSITKKFELTKIDTIIYKKSDVILISFYLIHKI